MATAATTSTGTRVQRPPAPPGQRARHLRQMNWLGRTGRLDLARDRDHPDLLDRDHQLQGPGRLLLGQPAGATDLPDAGELSVRLPVGLHAVLHQQRHRHDRRDRPGPGHLLHGLLRDRARSGPQAAGVLQRGVPDGSGHPHPGDDHPRLPHHHQAAPVRHAAGDHPAVHRVRHPAVGAGPDQLRPRRPEGALRGDAGRRRHASGAPCGAWRSR